jgi:photosystem II stability/assembly factor-like uncharacterized protein
MRNLFQRRKNEDRAHISLSKLMSVFLALRLLLVPTATEAQILRPFSFKWQAIDQVTSKDLSDLRIVKDGTGWTVGERGTILMTSDRGLSWKSQESGVRTDLQKVEIVDSDKAVVAGDEGVILTTNNGGKTWTKRDSGTDRQLAGISFVSPKTGWVVGLHGVVLATQDGGNTWTAQDSRTEKDLWAVRFFDDKRGLAVGDNGVIIATQDGGEHWISQHNPLKETLYSLAIVGNDTACAVGLAGTIIISNDAGWNWVTKSISTDETLFAVSFADPKLGWAVGGSGAVLTTQDGGETWTQQIQATNEDLWAVQFTDSKHGCVIGQKGAILLSDDSGQHWKSVNETLLGVDFVSPDVGWIVGDAGTVLKTTNGGETWSAQRSGTQNQLVCVAFVNGKLGWAAGGKGTIISTRDGGETWALQQSPFEVKLYRIAFATPDSGWIVGDKGTILFTQDGGQTWMSQHSNTVADLRDIYLFDLFTGCAVGGAGTILTSSDRGRIWVPRPSGSRSAFLGVYFADPKTGWVTGTEGAILTTHDGGLTWSRQDSGVKVNLWRTQFASPNIGWAVGGEGTVVATINGGQTWRRQQSGTDQTLWDLKIIGSSVGFAPGSANTIIRATSPSPLPYVTNLKITEDLTGKVDLVFTIEHSHGEVTRVKDVLFRTDKERGEWRSVQATPVKSESVGLWRVTWNPSLSEFGVSPGRELFFKFLVEDGPEILNDQAVDVSVVYWPLAARIWTQDQPVVIGVLAVLVALAIYLGIFWMRPVTFAHFSGINLFPDEAGSTGPKHWVFFALRSFLSLLVIPWFSTHRRVREAWLRLYKNNGETFGTLAPAVREHFLDRPEVLDAWVERTISTAKASLERLKLFEQRRQFIALPIVIGDTESGALIDQPSGAIMRQYFVRERVVFQIVGVGGSGKSTLACALARWAMAQDISERLDAHRMIPVFIAEDTNDLLKSVTAQLRTMIGEEELDDEIVSSLLRHKRLLVILDALSERKVQTQEYVASLFGQECPINALIMTARREADLGALDMITIRTEPIDARTLIPFIYEYLRRRKVATEFDQRSQLRLGERVLALVENGGTITVTPLLVTIFVDSALGLLRGGRAIEELPPTIPDVFIDYLQRLNPKVPDTPNLLDDECMLLASRVLSRISLRKVFVPSDFKRDSAETALKGAELGYEPDRIIDRLIANGVLNERKIGGVLLLRYALDPIAEYLAAIDVALRCGDDEKAWSRVTEEISATDGFPERINGFLGALSDCYISYRTTFNFPPLALPWETRVVT